MPSEQHTWLHLDPPLAGRLSFLRKGKAHAEATVLCRLPGCDGVVTREQGGRGRTRWFHDPACLKEASKRRRALDDAIADLAQQYFRNGATARERRSVAWDAKWLLGVRSTYPSGNESRGGDAELTDERHAIVQRLQVELGALARPTPVWACPTCKGTGEVAKFHDDSETAGMHALAAIHTSTEILSLLNRLVMIAPEEVPMRWRDEVAQWTRERSNEVHGQDWSDEPNNSPRPVTSN